MRTRYFTCDIHTDILFCSREPPAHQAPLSSLVLICLLCTIALLWFCPSFWSGKEHWLFTGRDRHNDGSVLPLPTSFACLDSITCVALSPTHFKIQQNTCASEKHMVLISRYHTLWHQIILVLLTWSRWPAKFTHSRPMFDLVPPSRALTNRDDS